MGGVAFSVAERPGFYSVFWNVPAVTAGRCIQSLVCLHQEIRHAVKTKFKEPPMTKILTILAAAALFAPVAMATLTQAALIVA
jgi:hypothetical protein